MKSERASEREWRKTEIVIMNSNLRLLSSHAMRPKWNRTQNEFFHLFRIEYEEIRRQSKTKTKQSKTIKNMFEKSWKINFYSRDFCYCCCCCFLLWCVLLYRCFLFIAIQKLFSLPIHFELIRPPLGSDGWARFGLVWFRLRVIEGIRLLL